MAWLYRDKGDLDAARASAEKAEEILAPMEPSVVHGYVKNMLGVIELSRGNWQGAREILLQAVSIGAAIG